MEISACRGYHDVVKQCLAVGCEFDPQSDHVSNTTRRYFHFTTW